MDYSDRKPIDVELEFNKSKESDEVLNDGLLSAFKENPSNKVNIYDNSEGPKIYNLKGKFTTPPVIVKKLPEASAHFFMFGKPEKDASTEDFVNQKIKQFVGCGLSELKFEKLAQYCSIEHLKTGKELSLSTKYPILRSIVDEITTEQCTNQSTEENPTKSLTLLKRKMLKDTNKEFLIIKRLKYRGLHIRNIKEIESNSISHPSSVELVPGKDLFFRIRLYKPNFYNPHDFSYAKRAITLLTDIVLCGKNTLAQLRDQIVCPNDFGLRLDVSENPNNLPTATAKQCFPSGYLFINNVFYIDDRPGCSDLTRVVREWASSKGIGTFKVRSMTKTTLEDMVLRLGNPEVYIHQGNCEHLFVFSEIRLINHNDALSSHTYPCHTTMAHHQAISCTTCAVHAAKWIVTGCVRLPFDPAFFCDSCFKMYLYKDGEKLGTFKAYSYRGNELKHHNTS